MTIFDTEENGKSSPLWSRNNRTFSIFAWLIAEMVNYQFLRNFCFVCCSMDQIFENKSVLFDLSF